MSRGNVAAPLNTGSVDQIKSGGLGLDALAVFGNAILSGTSRYLNFGDSAGEVGYGIRDNDGTMEFKNSAGNWRSFLPATGVLSITFADGTTQTTAADSGTGGITDVTTATCTATCSGAVGCVQGGSCTVSCPTSYYRTGCSGSGGVVVSGSNGCRCTTHSGTNPNTCYVYCAK